ncbi:MAG TPA: thiamine-phosphate kinase [Candidatus Eisenbacteria bacterium]|nr:thiamine-phosphate kinase [Candidatus Eisenbacteria bacterium]
MQTVQDLGEERLVARIGRLIAPLQPGRLGIGDDAAVVSFPGKETVLTTDTLVENVHFRRSWCTPEDVGWKALAVNLSDVAAMGAHPVAALVSLILPPTTPVSAVLGFYRGMRPLAGRHAVDILGGNLARGPVLSLTLTVLGESPDGRPLLRSGARPGDRLFVSGQPGEARLGCLILDHAFAQQRISKKDPWTQTTAAQIRERRRVTEALPGSSTAVRHFLRPEPRLDLARSIRGLGPTSLMDLSDGLAADLPRLARASGVGIVVEADALPASRAFRHLCEVFRVSAERITLEGGEDYELIMTRPAKAPSPDPKQWWAIGEITSGNKILLRDPSGRTRPLRVKGYDHFKR